MKLIVGLGNPGRSYERTRHNAGYVAVDRLIDRHAKGATPRGRFNAAVVEASIAGTPCLLMKPTTYMNRSGAAVAEAVGFYKLDPTADLFVIVDDVALPAGALRIRPGGGAGGHNGLSDLQRALGTELYPRCRVGIGASPEYMDQADHVLGKFNDWEWAAVEPAIVKAADAAEEFVTRGIDACMNRFNVRPPRGDGDTQD
ncbi:MAG: aminoacyl-tRNA hydrolase [Phycisphaerales bacterium]